MVRIQTRGGGWVQARLLRANLRPKNALLGPSDGSEGASAAAGATASATAGAAAGAAAGAGASGAAAIEAPGGIDPSRRRAWEKWHRGFVAGSTGGSDGGASGGDGEDPVGPADCADRLQHVCGALDLMDRLRGHLPADLNVALALAAAAPGSGGGGRAALGGARCFELLARAMGEARPNYWALWAFVNGLYYHLKVRSVGASIRCRACTYTSRWEVGSARARLPLLDLCCSALPTSLVLVACLTPPLLLSSCALFAISTIHHCICSGSI